MLVSSCWLSRVIIVWTVGAVFAGSAWRTGLFADEYLWYLHTFDVGVREELICSKKKC
jgi:hypothetical protein